MEKNHRVRRTLLYVPASDQHKCEKALGLECDGIIFDLEDAVSSDKKLYARRFICAFLKDIDAADKEILVRINQITGQWGFEDLQTLIPCCPDTIIIPKACKRDIIAADVFVSYLEAKHSCKTRTGFIPLIETVSALEELSNIVEASERINGVQFGAEDFTKELEIKRTSQGNEIAFARSKLTMTARAYGLDAIDTPYINYKDEAGFAKELDYIKSIGMTAKTAIHPAQLKKINEAFIPTEQEVVQAREIIDAFEKSVREGKGACSLNGSMIDAPIVERALKVVKRHTMMQ